MEETCRDYYPNGNLLVEYKMSENVVVEMEFFIDHTQNLRGLLYNRVTFDPGSLPANVARIRMIRDSIPIAYEFFDAEGRQVDAKGRRMADKSAAERVLREMGQPNTLEKTLQNLEQAAKVLGKAWAETRRFEKKRAVSADKLAAQEKALGIAYPPSFKHFVMKQGLFSLGNPRKGPAYQTWALKEHEKALSKLAGELDCEPNAAEVAGKLGLKPEVVAVLDQIVLVGCEGDEDFVGFDLRTRNAKTGECSFGFVLWDDSEIEALAEENVEPCQGCGFDEWLEEHIRSKSE